MTRTSMDAAPPVEVSVVVATRNRAALLDECLESLVAQRGAPAFEVVVVDNGSTDGTSDLLVGWTARDPRIRVVEEPRIGLSAAKNAGAAAARAPTIVFTDDDVIADDGLVATYARAFGAGPHDVVRGGRILPVTLDLAPWPGWLPQAALADIGMLDLGGARQLSAEYLWGANMAMSSGLFDRLGPWDETVGRRGDERGTFEDTEYQDRARAASVPVHFTPEAVVHHRIDRRSITPRHVLRAAYLRSASLVRVGTRTAPTRHPLRMAISSATAGSGLILWQLAFACTGRPAAFARCHQAAIRAGSALERFDPVPASPTVGASSVARLLRRIVRRSFRLTTPDPGGRWRRSDAGVRNQRPRTDGSGHRSTPSPDGVPTPTSRPASMAATTTARDGSPDGNIDW